MNITPRVRWLNVKSKLSRFLIRKRVDCEDCQDVRDENREGFKGSVRSVLDLECGIP